MPLDPSAANHARQNGQARPAIALQHQAQAIAETYGAGILIACTGPSFSGAVQPIAFKQYRDEVLAASGRPTDPIEVMLVEQTLWAHYRLGQLHVKAIDAASTEAASMLNAAVARLMSECRKHALALREYRSPFVPKQVTVVKQQNLAAGDQQIALVEGNGVAHERPAEKTFDSKLVTPGAIGHAADPVFLPHHAESQPSLGRALEPLEARPLNGRGPRTASAISPGP